MKAAVSLVVARLRSVASPAEHLALDGLLVRSGYASLASEEQRRAWALEQADRQKRATTLGRAGR